MGRAFPLRALGFEAPSSNLPFSLHQVKSLIYTSPDLLHGFRIATSTGAIFVTFPFVVSLRRAATPFGLRPRSFLPSS